MLFKFIFKYIRFKIDLILIVSWKSKYFVLRVFFTINQSERNFESSLERERDKIKERD